jgi:threonine aldolase
MISFSSDYIEGCAPEILARFAETNLVQQTGYGADIWCESAKARIREAVGKPEAEVFFICGGTQTNMITIDAMLKSFEGVVSVTSGHINGHEAGAVEATGHKILQLPEHDGLMDAGELKKMLADYFGDHSIEHLVKPGMVYISYPTEFGTLYTKQQLQELADICHEYGLPLFADGARLGYGLASRACDLTLKEFADIVDVFYIGGTKVGALCGEALVFSGIPAPEQFFTQIKRRGGIMAKGRVVGIQFDELFRDGLYMRLSEHCMEMAELLKKTFVEKGYELLVDSPTNQQFVIMDRAKAEELSKEVVFSHWSNVDEKRAAYRFVTSWATPKENIEKLGELL